MSPHCFGKLLGCWNVQTQWVLDRRRKSNSEGGRREGSSPCLDFQREPLPDADFKIGFTAGSENFNWNLPCISSSAR